MAHHNKSYPLRMPDEMRDYLQLEADKNNRSLNAEIVVRLQGTIPGDVDIPKENFARPSSSRNSSLKKTLSVSQGKLLERPAQWKLDDLQKFKESVDYMMKMLEALDGDLPSSDATDNESTDDTHKDDPRWGEFK